MSQALLGIQNILQNSNIFIGSRETVLITPFGKKKVTQFSGLPPTSVSYLNVCLHSFQCTPTRITDLVKPGFHYTANATTTTQKQSDYKVKQSFFTLIALF